MSYKPWLAMLSDGRLIRWSDKPPHVDGHDALTDEVLLRLKGAGQIALTPVGPAVDLDPTDPLAVLAVLREIDPKLRVSREGPTTDTLPEGAVS